MILPVATPPATRHPRQSSRADEIGDTADYPADVTDLRRPERNREERSARLRAARDASQTPATSTRQSSKNEQILLASWLLAILAISTATLLGELESALLPVLAGAVFVAAALPLFTPGKRPLHHPSVIFVGLVCVFVIPKALWVAINGVDNFPVRFGLLRGHNPSALTWGLLALIAGYFALSLGVIVTTRPIPVPNWRLFRKPSAPNWTMAKIVTLLVFGISMIGILLFWQWTGFDTGPGKRFSGEGGRLGAIGYLWFRMALLSRMSLVAAGFWWLQAKRDGRNRTANQFLAIAGISGVVALATPYLADNRAGVAMVLVDMAVLTAALGSTRRRWVGLLGGSATGFGVIAALFSNRFGVQTVGAALDSFVLSRDLADFSKVGVILVSGFRTDGNSLWHWLLIPLPPQYVPFENEWINLGLDVWDRAYGSPVDNGVPPSLAGELAASFGWLGIPIGMFLFGMLTKAVYLSVQNLLAIGAAGGIVLLIFSVRFSIFSLSLDFGTGVVKGALEAAPLLLIFLVGEGRSRKSSQKGPPQPERSQRPNPTALESL